MSVVLSSSRSDRRLSLSGLSLSTSQSQSTQQEQEQSESSLNKNYGFIESLEISNFKSYFGSTIIGPFSSFTCIIGPNGSGKSNLMDAISFVLGVKTQQLRGKKLTDLIHRMNFNNNNNDKNKNNKQKQPTKAFVELIYISRKLQTDNTENETDEPRFEEERMAFRRSITKNGSTINQYNNEKLDFKQYEQILSTIGVIVRARNFLVFQGDVTNIAQKTGKQLTKWFEQISGSDGYKQEYDVARKEQEIIQNEYEAVNETNRNLAREKKQMRQQKDEANSFKSMQTELLDLKSEYYRFQLYHIITDVGAAGQDIQRTDREMDEINRHLKDCEQEIKLKQADLSKSLRKKTTIIKNIKKLRLNLNRKQLQRDTLNKQLASFKTEESKLSEENNVLIEHFEENNDKLVQLKRESDALKAREEEYLQELKTESDDIELEENQYEIYANIKSEIFQQTASLNTNKTNLENIYQRKKDRFDSLQNNANILTKKEEKLLNNINVKIKHDLNILDGEIEAVKKEYKEREHELLDVSKNRDRLNSQKKEINNNLERLLSELKVMDIGIRDNNKEKQQYQILQTLQKLFTGIYGRLCDLIDVRQKRFALSVAVGLGVNNNAIIVENKQTAIKCMQHMRKTRRGHFRFLPLNDIKTYRVSQELRRFGGSAQPMMDVINYDAQFERAVQFALSNTIVVEHINEARDIAYNNSSKIRVVSLDGSVIQPNGNICGGFSKDLRDKAHGFNMQTKSKKVKERDDLIQHLKAIDDELIEADDGNDEDEKYNVNELVNMIKNKEFRHEALHKQLSEKEKVLKSLQKEMKAMKRESRKHESEVVVAKKNFDALDVTIREKENAIFGEFGGGELGVSSMREYEEFKLKRIEERTEQKKKFNVELIELENKYTFVLNKNVKNKKEIKKLDKRIQKLKREITAVEHNKLQKLNKEIEKAERNMENEEHKSDEIQDEAKSKRQIVSDKKKEIDLKRREITDKMKEKGNLKGWVEKLSQTQKNILLQAKHEMVPLKSKKQLKSPKKKKKKKKGGRGHRRKRRRKNDGDSSDEREDDESDLDEDSDEEHKTDDDDLMDLDEPESEQDSDDDDVDIVGRMTRRLGGIDLTEFERKSNDNNRNNNNIDAMDEDEFEDEDEEEEEEKKGEEFEYESHKKSYLLQIEELANKVNELEPNMKALEQYKRLQNKWKSGKSKQKEMRKKVSGINNRVDKIREERCNKFTDCFDRIQANIGIIYSELTRNRQYKNGGKAFLNIGGLLNPFDDEIVFAAMPPGKPFRDIQQLSGGEKSVASLALLFAIHSYKQSPFFILDEIDAALDQKNVQRVCNYIKKKSIKQNTQIIVISLKDKFFSNADSLIGVCKNRISGDCSRVLSIDLTKYDKRSRQQQQENGNNDEKKQNNI